MALDLPPRTEPPAPGRFPTPTSGSAVLPRTFPDPFLRLVLLGAMLMLPLGPSALGADTTPGTSTSTSTAPAQARKPIPDKLLVLTFDDSVASHHSVARRLLKRLGFGATFFITEGFAFRSNKTDYMTWEQIAELHRDGFEIGNHTRDHWGVTADTLGRLPAQLEAIAERCREHGIPTPVSFAWPGNAFHTNALPLLRAAGIRWARRGSEPEVPYKEGGGNAYEPGADHPLLIPSAGDARPTWTLADFQRAALRARDGRVAVIQFHGVPEGEHPWVHTPRERFEEYMTWLQHEGFTVIALRDLARYVDPDHAPADPTAILRQRMERKQKEESAANSIPARAALEIAIRPGSEAGGLNVRSSLSPGDTFDFRTCEGVLTGSQDLGLFLVKLPATPGDGLHSWRRDRDAWSYRWRYRQGIEVEVRVEPDPTSGPDADILRLQYTLRNRSSTAFDAVQLHTCLPTTGAPRFLPVPETKPGHPAPWSELYRRLHVWTGPETRPLRFAETRLGQAGEPHLALPAQGATPVDWAWWRNTPETFGPPLVALTSRDGTTTMALAFDQARWASSNTGDNRACFHLFPWFGRLEPGATASVRGRWYLLRGGPDAALARFRADFPAPPPRVTPTP